MMTEMAKSREAMARNVVALSGRVRRFMKWNLSMFPLKENKSILDLGSGPGMYFAEIMAYSPSFYLAADNNPNALGNLVKLMTDKPDCRVINLDLMDQKAISDLQGLQFDYVLCLDVIEHIDDDRMALINIRRILELTGRGTLFLRVPAISFIYGENDRAIGHYRRYSLAPMKKMVEKCGFQVERIGYQNIFGIVPWWAIGRMLKRKLAVSSEEGRIFDSLVPFLQRAERLLPPPIGLSLYCCCRLTEGS